MFHSLRHDICDHNPTVLFARIPEAGAAEGMIHAMRRRRRTMDHADPVRFTRVSILLYHDRTNKFDPGRLR